jgi:hypothetical protein
LGFKTLVSADPRLGQVVAVQEGRLPASITQPVLVGQEVHVEALAQHPGDDGADAGP